MDTPDTPTMPGFFQAWLDGLADHQVQAMYEWAVSDPDAGSKIVDATQPRGNVYGEGV